MKSLGELIREARKSLRLTQWEIADELNVARTTVSNWECGRSQPDFSTVCKLSQLLQCDLLKEHTESSPIYEPTARKMRLQLANSPVIEVVSLENSCVFSDIDVNLHVIGSDSHGNPIDINISAGFCVKNDDE